jgi:hypothetical protein
MGKSYHLDPEIGISPFVRRLWRNVRSCHWVEECSSAGEEGYGIVFFRNRNASSSIELAATNTGT